MLLYFIIVLIIISIITLFYIKNIREELTTDNVILYSHPRNLLIDSKYISLSESKNIMNNINYNLPISYYNASSISLVIDPLNEFIYLKDSNIKSTVVSTGYFLSLSFFEPSGCTYDLYYKTIGYITDSDLYFIKSIIYGYHIDEKTVTLKQLNPYGIDYNTVDRVITYITIGSIFYKTVLNRDIYIYGFKDIDINRLRLFYPFVENTEINISKLFPNKTKIEITTTNAPIMFLKIIKNIPITEPNIETFLNKYIITNDALDPSYSCFGMDTDNKALCNSPYDILGKPKEYISIWDKGCTQDEECAFFKANKNYPNSFGGCKKNGNIGICEFPIGIKRIGFRKYNDKYPNIPFCYGCKNNDIDCCSKQKEPDYAFPRDTELRKKYNKEILISQL